MPLLHAKAAHVHVSGYSAGKLKSINVQIQIPLAVPIPFSGQEHLLQ